MAMMVRLMVRKRSWGAWDDLGLVEESEAVLRAAELKKDGWSVLTLDVPRAA